MQKKLQVYFSITSLGGAVALIALFVIPHEPSGGLGYSLERWVLILGLLLLEIIAIIASFHYWRETPFSIKISDSIESTIQNNILQTILTTFLVCVLALGIIFIYVLVFIPNFLGLGAYMVRLAPVVLFGSLATAHLLFIIISKILKAKGFGWIQAITTTVFQFLTTPISKTSKYLRTGWIQAIAITGFLFITTSAFIRSDYRREISGLPFVLLLILGFSFFAPRFHRVFQRISSHRRYRWPAYILLAALGFSLAYFYSTRAIIHSNTINTSPRSTDQGAYMNFSREVYTSGFEYTGGRNRMPVYPTIQALFYDPGLSDSDFFDQGKRINTYLSLISLIVLFFVFRKLLPLHDTLNLTLITAFSLYIYKSAYFQTELLFYTLNSVGFLALGILLIKPNIKLSLFSGILIGVAHLTKASVLPGLIIFLGISLILILWTFFKGVRNEHISQLRLQRARTHLFNALVVGISFLGVIFPYISESKQVFGHYFYNVNSTFYFWYDSWEEAKEGTRAYGDRVGWPNMPPEEIPSFRKYLQEHDSSQIIGRIVEGLRIQEEHFRNQYGMFNYIFISFAGLISLVIINPHETARLAKKYFPLVLFGVLFSAAYILLFAWYTPIASGRRFTASLFIPILSMIFVASRRIVDGNESNRSESIQKNMINVSTQINYFVSFLLIGDIYFGLTRLLFLNYYGR